MKYLHYWHFADRWYVIISDDPDHMRIPSGNEEDYYAYAWKEEYLIDGSAGLTHRQVKEILSKRYPYHVLIKEVAYHEGSRCHGTKGGSREKDPCKRLVNRAKYREKDPIKERNVARQIHTCE